MTRAPMTLAAATILAMSTTATAQKPIEVGGFIGWHVLSPKNAFGADAGLRGPDGDFTFGLRAGIDLHRWLALEGELNLVPDDLRGESAMLAGWRVHALLPLFKGEPSRPRIFWVIGGGGLVKASGELPGDTSQFALHAGAGAAVPLRGPLGLRLDYRLMLSPSIDEDETAIDHLFTIGLYYLIGDKAPPPGEEEPAPADDSDGDGITDDVDECDDQAEDKDGVKDEDGCPEDDDGDGIADADDQCRTEPETKNGIDDEDGCPEKDEDGDGLLGSADKCPTEPEDKDSFADEDGCPDPDNDEDGVPDGADQCADSKETRNGYQDDDGCADEVPAAVQKFTGTIKGITFVFGSAKIARSSNKTLDAAAKVLIEHTSIKLEIQGHTDDVGKRETNMTLSQARADAVRDYLVKKGVEESRLRAVGYGPDKPVDPAKTKAARDKNRRVEFVIITQ